MRKFGTVESYDDKTQRGIIQILTGGKIRFVMMPGQSGPPVGAMTQFDVTDLAVNVEVVPENKIEEPQIVRGESALAAWASGTKQVREGSADVDAPSRGYDPLGNDGRV